MSKTPWFFMLALALGACDCGGDPADPTLDTGTVGDANFDGGGPGSCSVDEDCPLVGQVCLPTGACVTPGMSCASMADCTGGTYCDATTNSCLPGVSGSPCTNDDNCEASCIAGTCGCDGLSQEQNLVAAPLDIYMVFDRTGSMGTDCAYVPGDAPPRDSKACFATYALSDYLIDVAPEVDTRLAFQFMSQPDDCDGGPYETPLVDFTSLPVPADNRLIQEISDEDFRGGFGTHIEGALRGIATFTADNRTPGREMIGVLLTDGDPSGCEERIGRLATIISDHYEATGIKTFIIGMEGATEDNLEELAIAGGADAHDEFCGGIGPPCHYWNVGDGSGGVIAEALTAIVAEAVPLPCSFSVEGLEPPPGEDLDYTKVNVTLTEGGVTTTIGQVPSEADCPAGRPAWYYDNPGAPTEIFLCSDACVLVSGAADGARVDVVVGCEDTVTII